MHDNETRTWYGVPLRMLLEMSVRVSLRWLNCQTQLDVLKPCVLSAEYTVIELGCGIFSVKDVQLQSTSRLSALVCATSFCTKHVFCVGL